VGDSYYIANSTFEYAPGVPIHESKDMVNWTLAGHALHSRAQLDIEGQSNSGGIFAPTLRHHNGKFYMITTLTDGKWQLLVTADSVSGPWSEAVRVEIAGIDPDLFWDENGDCYMTYAALALGGLGQVKIDTETGAILGEPYLVWQGNGGKFPEGPHIYKIGDWYYMLIAEGGTERGHAVAIARSKNIAGPFDADPKGILLSNRGTDYTVQNTGHADLVERADGTWAMVFHGTRPRGASPEWHVMGRETCAVEIHWVDGWPQLGEAIQPAAEKTLNEVLDKKSALPEDWISWFCFSSPGNPLLRTHC
jgi:beta-xylosidase